MSERSGMKLVRMPLDGLPGPRGVPLLGPMGSMMRFFSDPVARLLELSAGYGDVVALARGDAALVCAFGAAHNRAVLSDSRRFENFAEVPIPVPRASAAARLINTGLTALNGDRHRARRRMVMSVFARSTVERYGDAMIDELEPRLARLQPGMRVDAQREMTALTLSVAMRCLFGLHTGDAEVGVGELGELAVRYLEYLVNPVAMLVPLDLPGTPYRTFMQLSNRLERRLLELVAARRRAPDLREMTDVLSLLIRAHDDDGTTMSDEELVAHVAVFFVASFETTANTLIWTLFLLAQHPLYLDELDAELSATLSGRAPTVAELPKLVVLDRVIRESMRLLPATPFMFMRRATEPFALGNHALPAGALVFLSPLVTHRDPARFLDPAAFRPERWQSLEVGTYEYMPFGAGPRLCVGASFAAQAIRIILAILLQRIRPTLADGVRVDRKVRGIVLGLRRELPIDLVARGQVTRAAVVRGDIHDLVNLPSS